MLKSNTLIAKLTLTHTFHNSRNVAHLALTILAGINYEASVEEIGTFLACNNLYCYKKLMLENEEGNFLLFTNVFHVCLFMEKDNCLCYLPLLR